jgi:hypothetical protein
LNRKNVKSKRFRSEPLADVRTDKIDFTRNAGGGKMEGVVRADEDG